jgi:hypothetical protein
VVNGHSVADGGSGDSRALLREERFRLANGAAFSVKLRALEAEIDCKLQSNSRQTTSLVPKVNTTKMAELTWSSPKGKFSGAGREISEALGRKPESTDLNERHPFDVELSSARRSACSR